MLTERMREDLVALIAATEAMQQMKAAVILAMAILEVDASVQAQISILANRDDKILMWQDKHDWMHKKAMEESQDSPPITASPTKAEPSVVDSQPQTAPMETDAITQRIPLSQRLRGALTAAERTHVVRCCECQERLDLFWSQLWTHVPAVGGIEPQEATPSTSAKPDSPPFAQEAEAAASPSSASTEPASVLGWREARRWQERQVEWVRIWHERIWHEGKPDIVTDIPAELWGALVALLEALRPWCAAHNARGLDGPCDCDVCRALAAIEKEAGQP